MSQKIEWKLIEVRAGDLKPNPNNPKKRDEVGMRRLRKLVDKYGLVFSGIVNKDLQIIDGHSRSELSKPDEMVMVFIPDRQLKPDEYKEVNALFDMARAGTIDMQMLEEQFKDQFFEEWEIDRTGKTIAVGDFFVGSGSTMVTCHQLGRKCYAMDNDPKFVHVTLDRMLKLDPSIKIKCNGKNWKLK